MKITKKKYHIYQYYYANNFHSSQVQVIRSINIVIEVKSYTKNIKNIELKLNKINFIVTVTNANQNKNDCHSCNCDYSIDLSHLRSNYLKQVVLK